MDVRRAAAGGRWTRVAALSLAAAATAGALTSCGVEDRGASYSGGKLEKVVPEDERRGRDLSVRAMGLIKGAESMRVGVEMAAPKGRQKISLHMDRDGNCTGTFDGGPMRSGELIVIEGEATYVRLSDESLDEMTKVARLRGPEGAARAQERVALARGKYLKVAAGKSFGGSSAPVDSCDLDTFLSAMPGAPSPDNVVKALPRTRRYGQDVIPLVEHEGGEGGDETSVYVAAHGKPYVLGLETQEDGGTMKMRLSDYDEPVGAVAPDPARTLDIAKLGGGSGGGSLFEV
ncbi:hypothetical protein [Streptomyces sp. NPDC087300]|uniref:hypothetical protein n=1 Tax=Streptomyces sp. NPDC087300 TaxID=3365780 RepID=UPI00382981F4